MALSRGITFKLTDESTIQKLNEIEQRGKEARVDLIAEDGTQLEFKDIGDIVTDVYGNKYIITKTGFSGAMSEMISVEEYVMKNFIVQYEGKVIIVQEMVNKMCEEYLRSRGE